MNLMTATTILSMTGTTAAGILLACAANTPPEVPDAPPPVDRPSVAETVPDLPDRFKDCATPREWKSLMKDTIPHSVIVWKGDHFERLPTAKAWAPLEFFGGTETTTDDHWIIGNCSPGWDEVWGEVDDLLDAPDHA